MALAVRAANWGKGGAHHLSAAHFAFGTDVVGVKLTLEWRHDYLEGLAPGVNWTFDGPDSHHLELFLLFFTSSMTRRPRPATW